MFKLTVAAVFCVPKLSFQLKINPNSTFYTLLSLIDTQEGHSTFSEGKHGMKASAGFKPTTFKPLCCDHCPNLSYKLDSI